MMTPSFKTATSALAIALMGTAAAATTTVAVFDLTAQHPDPAYGNQGNAFTLTTGALSATFRGNSFSSIDINTSTNEITSAHIESGDIYRWETGAGIINSAGDNSHTVDGSGWKDFVEVSFSQAVTMHEVEFSYFTADQNVRKCKWTWWGKQCSHTVVDGDDFRWMFDASGDGELGVGDYISANQSANPFTEFGGVTNNVFGFGAFDHNDDWKLKTVTVKYDEPPSVVTPPPVPLPAAGWMLLAGFGGMAALRRRKAR